MTSYLIDLLLMVALVVTALRCGRMHKELRALRQTDLAEALVQAEVSLNRAAEAIVGARHEGIETVFAMERHIADARHIADELSALVTRADFHVQGGDRQTAPDVDSGREFFSAAQDRLHASLAR